MGLRPFSVVQVEQAWRKARELGDLVIRWTRRSRVLAADSWAAAEAPLAEEREAYEVEILDGATVLRTLATSTTSPPYETCAWVALLIDSRIFSSAVVLVAIGARARLTRRVAV